MKLVAPASGYALFRKTNRGSELIEKLEVKGQYDLVR